MDSTLHITTHNPAYILRMSQIYQRLGWLRDERTALQTGASVDHQGGQRVWRREGDKDEKAKRQIGILRKVERLPRQD